MEDQTIGFENGVNVVDPEEYLICCYCYGPVRGMRCFNKSIGFLHFGCAQQAQADAVMSLADDIQSLLGSVQKSNNDMASKELDAKVREERKNRN